MRSLVMVCGTALALAAMPLAAQEAGTTMAPAEAAPGTAPSAPALPDRGRSFRQLDGGFAGRLSGELTADELIGATVRDAEGNSVGEISDLVIGSGERIEHAVVDVGGFLGLGAKPVAVELGQLRRSDDGDALVLTMSRPAIEALPELRDDDGWWLTGG